MSAVQVKIDLQGMDRVNPMVQKAILNGLKKAGFAIERSAKIHAPKDTGRLAGSIHSKMEGNLLMVQDNVEYGVFQELGTRFMASHPFMNPALKQNIPNIKKFIENEIRRTLK